jgi:hypothetical protein
MLVGLLPPLSLGSLYKVPESLEATPRVSGGIGSHSMIPAACISIGFSIDPDAFGCALFLALICYLLSLFWDLNRSSFKFKFSMPPFND